MTREIKQLPFWRLFLVFPAVLIIRLWTLSLRIRISKQDKDFLNNYPHPVVFAFWHNRLFVAHELHRRFRNRPIYGLISASKDGAWLAAVFKLLGIGAIRGSSSWRGGQAFKELLSVLQNRNDVALTPDGPRGPRYVMKKGFEEIAKQSHSKCVFVNIEFSSYWSLNSWDAFIIPKPFSTLTVKLNEVHL